MAVLGPGTDIGFIRAGADLSSSMYKFVTLDASGEAVVATGSPVLGVILNAPGSNAACQIRVAGCAKLIMAEACDPMDRISSNASGKGVVADPSYVDTGDPSPSELVLHGEQVAAIALSPSTGDGDIIEVLVVHMGALAEPE
ncbi:MAG: hypothetical protein M0Q12_00130 [Synergistaceae bacterium]|jgi:hypothetical protein|nr:hypothetical protein [Synergistaceae bacterium]